MEILFTPRELDVMNVLWEHGASTGADVRARMPDDPAYTTVLTMLRRLEEKGYVAHEEDGRAHRFYPLVEREAARRSAVEYLVRKLFKGSSELLLTQLVSDEELTPEELERIRAVLRPRARKEEE